MSESLDENIIKTKNEILNLKNQYIKKMSQLKTITYEVPISFTLERYNYSSVPGQYRIKSQQDVRITATIVGTEIGLISWCIDINNPDGRIFDNNTSYTGSPGIINEYLYLNLYIVDSKNQNDIDAILAGQNPTLNYNLIIVSTSELNIEVNYV